MKDPRSWFVFLAISATLVAGCAASTDELDTSSSAIINGELDGDEHPGVGALAFNQGAYDGGEDLWSNACTLENLGHGVLLTAGHCVPPPHIPLSYFGVHFHSEELPNGDNLIPVEAMHSHPLFDPAAPLPGHDVGVILVDPEHTEDVEAYPLPPIGVVDEYYRRGHLTRENALVIVGYGLREIGPPAPRRTPRQRGRMTADLVAPTNIVATQTLSEGDAGPITGDSGGPVFLQIRGRGENLIGTISLGDPYDGRDTMRHYHQRLDTLTVQQFLNQYLPQQDNEGLLRRLL